ncbi:MAG: Gfo/Idh/MocA family oxidoreductase [Kiritimatiellia bacterium]
MTQTQSETIRVAIAGQGRSGYNIHANCLRKMPDQYRIVAVADQLEERREEAKREFGARAYADWTELLADGQFDLFVNALPTPLHLPATLAALAAGKHVLCEKPMSASVAEFDRMVEAAARHKRVLAPFQNNRHQPFFEKIQEVVASGVLGKLVYIRSCWSAFSRRWDWQTWQKNMGGSLLNTGPHALDQALVLFGDKCKPHVFCRMDSNNPFGADAEDHCTVTLYDPGRQAPQIDIFIGAYMAYPQGERYNIGGTFGGLSGNETQLKWRYFDPAKAPAQAMWNWSVGRKYPHETLPWVEETWNLDPELADGTVGYTLRSLPTGPFRIYGNLYDVLRKGEPLLIGTDQVRRQIEILEECHRQNPLPRRA